MAKYVEIVFRFKLRFLFLLFPSYKATAQLWIDEPGYFGATALIRLERVPHPRTE